VPGLLLYLLIGRPTYPRSRRRRIGQAAQLLAGAGEEIRHSSQCQRPQLPENFRQATLLIEAIGRFPALAGNLVSLNSNYDAVIDEIVSAIDGAQHHVHILMYIFADDETGERVIAALARASARGVQCRVLIDALGSRPWSRRVIRQLRNAGVEAARALPVFPWRAGSARADLRNHRKIVVIDGTIAFAGSQNIVNARWSRSLVYEELVARLDGPAALELQAIFAADWFLETATVLSGPAYFPHRPGAGTTIAQVLPSGPDYGDVGIGQLTVAAIHGAQSRVVITTPYFIPHPALLEAMQTAVLRGVDVQLVLPEKTDNLFVRLAQRSYYSELLRTGIRVHHYRPAFLHAKHVSIDSRFAMIGSSNVDVRSFVLNAEATLILFDPAVVSELRREQDRSMSQSEELAADEWDARSPVLKFIENMARLVSPLL
jgi:cardiolipin synthase